MPDFLPRGDAELVMWTENFVRQIGGVIAECGGPMAEAESLAALQQAYAEAYAAAVSNATRTPLAITHKDECRAALVRQVRAVAGEVRARLDTTAAHRQQLGLKPKREGKAAVIPPPTVAPGLRVTGVDNRGVTVCVFDAASHRRRRPEKATAVCVLAAIGPTPPGDAEWRYATAGPGPTLIVPFAESLPPGTRVWMMACWQSPTAAQGPRSAPVDTYLPTAVTGTTGPVKGAAA